MKRYFFTSESVTEGHPDKICDKISDKILDEALKIDSDSHMAVETTIKDNLILLYGEASTKAKLDYERIVKSVLKDIGYNDNFNIITKISIQSPEINEAVNRNGISAGDQGIVFGYACSDTDVFMPLPIMLANKLTERLSSARKEQDDTFILPDGKSQVTVEYINDVASRIDTIIMAVQHKECISAEKLRKYIIDNVINIVVPANLIDEKTKILINTGGKFTLGGPYGDSGTTGRKIVVDTYGGMGRVGGGCFSSKDPSKVDRCGAYYARYVARNIVSHNLAKKAEIGLSYAIGQQLPIHIFIDTFGTEEVSIEDVYKYVYSNFNFSIESIIEELDLKRPIYYPLAAYGHFGRENVSWEKDKISINI